MTERIDPTPYDPARFHADLRTACLGALAQGQWGYSFASKGPVIDLVRQRLPQTLWVVGISYLIAVLVAVITPSADPISMLALTVPMVLFYEVAIIVGRVAKRRRAAAEAT